MIRLNVLADMQLNKPYVFPRVKVFDERLITIVGGLGNNAIIQDLSKRGKNTYLVGENCAEIEYLTRMQSNKKVDLVQTGVSANGTTQSAATLITKFIAEVTTASDSNNAVKLLKAVEIDVTYLIVNKSSVDIKVFPASGDKINQQAVDTSLTVQAGDMESFIVKSTS